MKFFDRMLSVANVAQLVEQLIRNQPITSSTLAVGTILRA